MQWSPRARYRSRSSWYWCLREEDRYGRSYLLLGNVQLTYAAAVPALAAPFFGFINSPVGSKRLFQVLHTTVSVQWSRKRSKFHPAFVPQFTMDKDKKWRFPRAWVRNYSKRNLFSVRALTDFRQQQHVGFSKLKFRTYLFIICALLAYHAIIAVTIPIHPPTRVAFVLFLQKSQ